MRRWPGLRGVEKKGGLLGQQSLGPPGRVELIFFEVNDGECAGVLDEFTHERGVGLKWTAVDRFAAEGARGQSVHWRMRASFFVAGSIAGDSREGFALGGIASGDEGGHAAVRGLAVDRQQRRPGPRTELCIEHRPGRKRRCDRREDLAPAALARRRNDARILGGTRNPRSRRWVEAILSQSEPGRR